MAMNKGQRKPRRPSALKERDGTIHSERENKLAPRNQHPGIPPAPPYLDDGEKESWEWFAEVLHKSYKILSKEHFAMFEALAICYDQMRKLDQVIRESKVVVETTKFDKQGNAYTQLAMHPAWSARRAIGQELRQLCGSFGLSPSDVGRVSMLDQPNNKPKKPKPEEEFGE